MTCESVPLPGGGRAIVCSKTPRCECGRPAPLLCDWKVPSKKSGICKACSTSPAVDKDLCPEHAVAFRKWKATR